MSTAVDVAQLSKRFGETIALDDVAFRVETGELFGFIGPDGAGKTTLFRILATLMVPDSGRATVLGHDVARDLWKIRPRLGYMAGRFSLYPDLSVEENLRFYASIFGTTIAAEYERIRPIYSQLEPFRDRRAGALSGGMKQKLALSCALVRRPELLLLDEPTTGVDAVSRREFWDLLAELKATGLTIIVSTPYMDEATRCDRVALIDKGKILATDRPAALTRAYAHPLLAVRAANRYGALLALRRFPHVHTVFPFGEVLHYADARVSSDTDAIAGEVERFLSEQQIASEAFVVEATIEDAFIERLS
ncbi:MAG TPA: ABC transporter ATP-binding protein [Thermoanaerobaculia bacterium]|jgi:ABC-type multidrug transport system ATPase subunit